MNAPNEILKKYWGYDQFRPKQLEIIQSVIGGADTMALLPTGGGKSICFQVPAMCIDGLCLVVSPLLALMNDQVLNLRKRGIQAFSVNSALHSKEIDRILDNCVYGEVKFLYVSPERLQNEMFLERFKKMKISLIAVDEAHCISQWGYDFRPEYMKIADIRLFKPGIPILALTASATPLVVMDIQSKLLFSKENVIGTSFARKNLSYNISEQEDKEGKLLEICRKMKGSGIVYCGTRFRTREISLLLNKNRIEAAPYHAGLSIAEKEVSFKKWMKNEVRIICATNAFGMGIDKSDVRFVVHVDVPPNPESYFQEAGRAGRDGMKAYAVLLFNDSDIHKLHKLVDQKFPTKEYVRRVYKCIGNYLQLAPGAGMEIAYTFNTIEFCKNFELNYSEAIHALRLLELAGYIKLSDAAFMPSRLIFRVGRQNLYSYQVVNQAMDQIIKLLLRMYGGLFEQYVNIREDDIAQNAGISRQQVIEKLDILSKHEVLEYIRQSDTPLLTFLTGRLHEDSITLVPDIYENRKKKELERIEVITRYLAVKRCRSIQLLEYFGEKNAHACGICDVCRENSKHGLRPDEFELINEAVMDLIIHKEFTLEDLPDLLPKFLREHLIEYARWKIDSGDLVLNDKLFITLPGMENE